MGGSKSSQTNVSYMPEQRSGLSKLLNTYSGEYDTGDVMADYPGSTLAEFTPTQKAAMGGAQEFLPSFGPADPSNVPNYNQTNQAIGGLLGGELGAQKITPEQTQGFFQSAIQDPAQHQFSEYTRPLIREEYSGPGMWGSARAQAVGKAGQELGNWLGQKRGELEWQVGETNRGIDEAKAGRTAQAVPMAQNQMGAMTRENQARLAGRQGVFGFAGQQQQQQQRMIQDSIEKYKAGKRLTDPEVLSIIMALVGQPMSAASGSQAGMSGLGQTGTAFGVGAGSALGAAMFAPAVAPAAGGGAMAGLGTALMSAGTVI